MDLGLSGRRAAVSAATAGLGLACAKALLGEGARVAICGHDLDRVDATVRDLGAAAVGLVADLTSPDECDRFVGAAQGALGGLDILITNGPGPPPGTFGSTTPTEYPAALDMSLLSVVHMCHAAVPFMRMQGWGRVVAITSLAVRQPIANLILSNTARAGATAFLKTLASEVAADGVTVNSVLPGLHDTARVHAVYGNDVDAQRARVPTGELGRPEDLGAVVAFLCSEQARFITGTAIAVDGGQNQALL